MPPSPFGQLGELPLDLRLEIYERLFWKPTPSVSILCCSRAIYEEITGRLYGTLDIDLTPSWHSSRLEICCKALRLHWKIQTSTAAIRDRFSRLPYHKTNLRIHIYAPDPLDPGQLVLLWMFVKTLASFLKGATIKSMTIYLQEYNGNDWQDAGRAVESIQYPGTRQPDHNIVFLPFCQLCNVKSLHIVPSTRRMDRAIDWGFINYGRDFILNNGHKNYNDGPLSQDPQYRDVVPLFDNLDGTIRDMQFFLDTHLDLLPGDTAAMLRLGCASRLSTSTFPRHHRELFLTLRECPKAIKLHDPGLERWCIRHWHHWNICLKSDWQSLKWPWDEWCRRYPQGLPPLTPETVIGYWQAIPSNPRHGWKNRGDIERNGEFHFWIWSYLHRNWGQQSIKRLRFFEREWCTDCRHMGFQEGCEEGCERLCRFDYREAWEDSDDEGDYSDPELVL
ncbi:hypothetical protein ASPACDRAFT_58349 [Aspergillus aculeatus ATCC 16872]|uniref:Uncharacterized protein n=1 Tax=Aspergillus aculeatus (strain ATCC 16872 / CBS 172.66 / WB 5094) TaxID=690307 RepID=A0A1L9X0H4_ASPA1|nr:uncharacterized protein ASPACDRAFT_58349 [Aspergillus aculeatus ATCC 16872]OJK01951.1 hypothetical protein ASPACDRAFT_58349 [Aspergillus aculeatus ATCC 16872]